MGGMSRKEQELAEDHSGDRNHVYSFQVMSRKIIHVADVQSPSLCLDFLTAHDLLIHQPIGATIPTKHCRHATPTITHISHTNTYQHILQEFLQLLSTNTSQNTHDPGICHKITTKGPPMFAKTWRMPPECREAAKRKFHVKNQQGVARHSDSAWASPLHMAPKQQEGGGADGVMSVAGNAHDPGDEAAANFRLPPLQQHDGGAFHLPSALQPDQWTDALPLIFLTIRASMKEDLHHSPAELVFGEDLHLPGQVTSLDVDTANLPFLPVLYPYQHNSTPDPRRHHSACTLHRTSCCIQTHRTPLQQLYTGPHPVLSRTDATVTLQIAGKPYVTS
ncbi:hypothetical protein Pmani_020977 [Petrolisthes manimaculis]|uniref:Uncharacterized protein n=1 Tax=Petrolisthes manimaculis TaxID=1843537 RepID=A0AAE1U5Y9_9EUCA|nr:hypothetical protein Pmani_020977 [Petrolisthes manimaculis]